MARPAKKVVFSEKDTQELIALAKRRNTSAGLSLRAKIILRCIEGGQVKDIASECGVYPSMVTRWRNRFSRLGMKGLFDSKRTGRPARYVQDFKEKVLAKIEQEPPKGFGKWDGVLLASVLGYSKHAVWRFLRDQRISLTRKRTWCISTDPEFSRKAADIVGLYLSRQENAIVVCVDEKPNIQALERAVGYAVSSDKKLVRAIQSTYKRNGTANLFAALEVASGTIHGKTTDKSEKTKKGFLSFMDDLLLELPKADEYHIIIDNHSIHKNHSEWLECHKNVFFHYTPTSASWLNMVEIWFGILSNKSLSGASFSSVEALCEQIKNFITVYNKTAKPFVWRKRDIKGAQLSNKVQNFCN